MAQIAHAAEIDSRELEIQILPNRDIERGRVRLTLLNCPTARLGAERLTLNMRVRDRFLYHRIFVTRRRGHHLGIGSLQSLEDKENCHEFSLSPHYTAFLRRWKCYSFLTELAVFVFELTMISHVLRLLILCSPEATSQAGIFMTQLKPFIQMARLPHVQIIFKNFST